MTKVSIPILSLVATALLLGINLGLQSARANQTDSPTETDSARADTCLAAPSTSTPKGQHWYFRTERGRKCWSLHAGGPLAHHAAARPRSKAATGARSTAAAHDKKPAAPEAAVPPPPTNTQDPAFDVAVPPPPTNTQDPAFDVAVPPPPPAYIQPAPGAAFAAALPGAAAEAAPSTTAVPVAGAPPPAGAVVQPQPHVEILRTEPAGVPTQQAAQPSAAAPAQAPAAQVAPDAKVAPAAQGGSAADGNATSPDSADAMSSNTGSEVKDAAVPEARPDAERDKSDAAQQEPAETPGLADAIATLQPTETFFLLAFGLTMVVFLVAIASRIAAKRREPIITQYPDPAWSNDQFDPPRLEAAQFAPEAMHEQRADEEQHVRFIEPRALDDAHQRRIKQPALTHKSTAALSALRPVSDSKSLEPVLRLLRQS